MHSQAQTVTVPLVDLSGNPQGSAEITNNPFGPDELKIDITGPLSLNTRHTVFLTNSPQLGDLPAQYVGEFTSTGSFSFGPFGPGRGSLYVVTEVFNAFASHNDVLENEDGIARPDLSVNPPAGLRRESGGFANTIPLNFLRVYEAQGTISVFGGNENEVGGGNVVISASAIPESAAVVAYLRGGPQKTIGHGFFPSAISDSLGDIVDYKLTTLTTDGVVLATHSSTTGSFTSLSPVGCAGQQYIRRLTVTDVNGVSDSYDQTVTVLQNTNGLGFTACIQ